MIEAVRITKLKHKETAFTGMGGQYASGRWHHKMTPTVYCSESCALAALETFVHLQEEAKSIKFISFQLQMPEDIVIDVEGIDTLPTRWRSEPPGLGTKSIGTKWLNSMQSAVLSVPSVIVPSERNYLINTTHPEFNKIAINTPEVFSFDSRMWK